MAVPTGYSDSTSDLPRAVGAAGLSALLRYSHIFATTVREILEAKLLREISPVPLNISQFHVLKLVSAGGTHQVGQVADFLGVSPPAATKNIDKLEGLGLVTRSRSSGDRRATFLSVSPAGRRLVDEYERQLRARLWPVLGDFSPDEVGQFRDLLERFSVSLLEHEPPEEGFCLRCAAYVEAGCPVGRVRGGCPYQKFHAAASKSSGGTA